MTIKREVIQGDAVEWCYEHPGAGPVITSPPDAAEIDRSIPEWRPWFHRAIAASLHAAGNWPAVFCVTDRRHHGRLESKAEAVYLVADTFGRPVTWHKIALRRPPGNVDYFRPTYSHLIAVGGTPGRPRPDVFDRGPVLYSNGMGFAATRLAVDWVTEVVIGGRPLDEWVTIINPFCGWGTVLAAAEERGLRSIGIDNDPAQCGKALISVLEKP